MSRSSKSNLIVRDDGSELLLGFAQAGNIVKNDLRFRVLLRALGNANLDRVNDREGGVSVINDFHGIVYAGYDNSGHIRAVVAVHGFCAAAPDKQSALDSHVIERNFPIRCAAADNQIAVHGQIFQFHVVGTNENAAFDVLVVGSFYRDITADDVMENLRKFRARDIVNIGLHFFLKDVRPMLPPVMNRSIVDA